MRLHIRTNRRLLKLIKPTGIPKFKLSPRLTEEKGISWLGHWMRENLLRLSYGMKPFTYEEVKIIDKKKTELQRYYTD